MKKLKVFIVFSDIENTTISYASSEILKYIRDNKNIIIFEDIKNIKLLDVPAVAMRTFKKPLEKYDAYYFFGGNVIKIKASSI